MVFGEPFSLEIFAFAVLLAPGLIGVKLYLYVTNQIDQYSRLDALVYSLGITVSSLIILYLINSIYIGGFVTRQQLSEIAIFEIIALYLLHVPLSLLIGTAVGHSKEYLDDDDRVTTLTETALNLDDADTRDELWDYTFENIYSDTDIRVVTRRGDIIEGEVMFRGQKAQERDLLISDPTTIAIDSNGVESEIMDDFGVYAYIHNQDISHILIDEDINRGDDEVVDQLQESQIIMVDSGRYEDELQTLLEDLDRTDRQVNELFESVDSDAIENRSGEEESD